MRVAYRGGSYVRAAQPIVDRSKGNLRDAGLHLAQEVRNRIAIQGPPRSSPGYPPHMDTQRLIASYDATNVGRTGAWEFTVAVGSDETHAVWLEEGTLKMAPRPHLVSTLVAQMNPMARIMGR